MIIIKKLILSEFLKVLFFTFMAFFSLFFIIDFVEKIDDFVENKASISVVAAYFLYKTPFIYSQIMPITALMATIVTLSTLNKHNEITAIKSGGGNLTTILTPLLTTGLLISISVFFLNEIVAPSTSRLSMEIEQNWIKKSSKKKVAGSFTKSGYWIKTKKGIIKIKSFENNNHTLKGVTVYLIDKNLTGSISTNELNWTGTRWKTDSDPISSFTDEIIQSIEQPSELGSSTKRGYKDMDYFELKSYIESLDNEGYNSDKYRVELFSKISFPFVSFIMVLIGLSFGLKSGRNSGITAGLAIAFLIGFSYWIVFGVSISLGTSGLVPPLISAFFTNILFLALGVLMLGYVKR